MIARVFRIAIAAAIAAPVVVGPAVGANDPAHWEYSVSATTLRTAEVDFDAGGGTRLTSHHLRAGVDRRIGDATELGARLTYDFQDRDFSRAGGSDAFRHLGRTNRVGIAGSLTQRTRFGWSYGVRPFVNWAFESGAFSGDAMSYGAALAVVTGLSGDKRIGTGARVSRDMENEIKLSPIIIVHWELNENWTVANPREANFTSPAGLEIRYTDGGNWGIALAGIHHSAEFRLDDQGQAPDGIGESSGFLSYVRATYRWAPTFRMNGYVGALFNGKLEVDDSAGDRVASSGYDTAPFVALALEGTF
ncbi:MAG: hypothetical protein U5R46_05195 [Gammaproteobacteria bacterium]|nr:hypothetical protein [Gammaproteobacteria bacterium]